MSVAPPPIFQHLFLEQPWPAMVLLTGVAAVLRVIARRHHKTVLNLVALAVLLAAGGVYALAWAVVTPREALMARTRQVVAATAPLNMAALQRMIEPDAPIRGRDQRLMARFNQMQPTLKAYPIRRQTLDGLNAQAYGSTGTSTFTLHTYFQAMGLPLLSTWALKWRYGPDGHWRVTRIDWLKWDGSQPPRRIP